MSAGINQYLSDTGLRGDGRRPHEVRRVECKLGVTENADGSSSFAYGNSVVQANVYGPQQSQTKEARQSYDKGTILCNVSTCNSSISERHDKSRFRRRDRLLAELIRETFEALVLLKLYARSTIQIHVEILQNDGGIDAACINAVCLALIDAGVALQDYCVACNAGYLGGHATPCVDLNYSELAGTRAVGGGGDTFGADGKQSKREAETMSLGANRMQKGDKMYGNKKGLNSNNMNNMNNMNNASNRKDNGLGYCSGLVMMVIKPQSGDIVTMQMQSMMGVEKFERLMKACSKACGTVCHVMQHAVKVHTFKLLQHRGFGKH